MTDVSMYTDGLIVPESVYVEPRNVKTERRGRSEAQTMYAPVNGYTEQRHELLPGLEMFDSDF